MAKRPTAKRPPAKAKAPATIYPANKSWHGGASPAKGMTFDQDIADYIIEEMYNGRTWIALCKEPGIPSRSTLHRWEEENAEFGKQVKKARGLKGHFYFENAHEAVEEAGNTQPNSATGQAPIPYWVHLGKGNMWLRMAQMVTPAEYSDRRVAPTGEPAFKVDEDAQREILVTLNERLRKKSASSKG